jgi:fucose permease
MQWAAITTLGSAFLAGLLLAAPGGLLPALSRQLGFPQGPARRLRFTFFLAFIPVLLLAGLLIDRWGSDHLYDMLALGALLAVVGLGMLCSRRTYRTALSASVILAGAAACVLPAATLLMPRVLYDGRHAAQAMNLGYLFVALGTLTTSGFFETFQREKRLRSGLALSALFALICAGLVIVPSHADLPPLAVFDPDRLFADPHLLFAGLMVLLYFPLEASLSSWGARYLEEIGHPPNRVVWLLALFWIGFLASRLLAAWFIVPDYAPHILFGLVMMIALVLGNLAGAGPSLGALGMLILWMCSGPVFPTMLGRVLPVVQGQALTFVLLYSLGSIGRLMFQPALSVFSRGHSMRFTALLPMGLGLLLMATTLVLVII